MRQLLALVGIVLVASVRIVGAQSTLPKHVRRLPPHPAVTSPSKVVSSTALVDTSNAAAPRKADGGQAEIPPPGLCARWRACFADWARQRSHAQYGLVKLGTSPGARTPLVVFVHGLNSRPEDLRLLIEDAQRQGHTCAQFRYPNDQPLADSSRLLSEHLRRLRTDQPGREVYLVTHSMGGLVARAAIENPELDPRNVRRIVMIAPPNQGSELARYACSLDFYEYFRSADRRRESGPIVGAYADGCEEATQDLQPGSAFLTELNQWPRNERVRYSLLIGSHSFVRREHIDKMQTWFQGEGRRSPWVASAGSLFDRRILPLEELFDCQGDGCVAVARAQLRGVSDVEVGRFSHNGLLMESDDPEVLRCRQWLIDRIQYRASRPRPVDPTTGGPHTHSR